MKRDLARATLEDLVALDHQIGRLMEIANQLDDRPQKVEIKECCGELLRLQFELIERIVATYPEFRDVDPTMSSSK